MANLTQAQRDTVKSAVLADPAIAPAAQAADDGAVATYLNTLAAPAFYVWRSSVPAVEIREAVVPTELDNLTNAKWRTFEWLSREAVDASRNKLRQAFDDCLATNAPGSRIALLGDANNAGAFARRATRAEKMLATGTGSKADPAKTAFEGELTPADVSVILRGA